MESTRRFLQKNIMCVMGDGKERNISDMKEGLEAIEGFKYGKDYREGHLAGCLRVLITNRELEKTGRGVYRLNRAAQELSLENILDMDIELESNEQRETCLEQMKKETLTAIERQYHSLVKRMDAVSLSSLSPMDFENVKQLSELKENLKKLLVKYGRILPQ